MTIEISVDGAPVVVDDEHATLLDVLRWQCGSVAVKDGCAPQGQCGCCTVLVDGQPRVSCVTPVRRIAGRAVVTADGLPESDKQQWADAFVATGASQCGFCTPGIICRLAAAEEKGVGADDAKLHNALAAHLCRCTGWQTIVEAHAHKLAEAPAFIRTDTQVQAAEARAALEGGVAQRVGTEVALGAGGFAVDSIPAEALFAVPAVDGDGWVVGKTLAEARASSGKIQGRRTTASSEPPIAVPEGEWERTLQTRWVEPAFLETETVWCEPGGSPSSTVANGGAFGAKDDAELGAVARRLADDHGQPVAVVLSREDSVRRGAKRPPMGSGMRADGTGLVHVARTNGVAEVIRSAAPGLEVVEIDLPGPPTSTAIRGAGWVEALALVASVGPEIDGADEISLPSGAFAAVDVTDDAVTVHVSGGDPLDETVLRSYVIGAVHMGLGLVRTESLTVDPDGEVHDLTIRSFGVLRSSEMPRVEVEIEPSSADPVAVSDAVFAATVISAWRRAGWPDAWGGET